MNHSRFIAVLLLALPLAANAQTTTAPAKTTPAATTPPPPPPGMQQITEVTEDLDPATGKVIRRTTRTVNVPINSPEAMKVPAGSAGAGTATTAVADARATDAQIATFLGTRTNVATLTAPGLLDSYRRFIEKVHSSRHNWRANDWALAASVLSSLNGRYDQLRPNLSLDDKITVRALQAEFQALRTARQVSDQVADKL